MICRSEKMMTTGCSCLSLALLSAVPCPLLRFPSSGFCQLWGWGGGLGHCGHCSSPSELLLNLSHFNLVLKVHHRVLLSTPGLVLFLLKKKKKKWKHQRVKCLRVPTGGQVGRQAGSPMRPAAELFNVPFLRTVSEHLLTSNKKSWSFPRPHPWVCDWVEQGWHERAGNSPQVAWGRGVGRYSAQRQKQAVGGWSGWGGAGMEDLVGQGLGQESCRGLRWHLLESHSLAWGQAKALTTLHREHWPWWGLGLLSDHDLTSSNLDH